MNESAFLFDANVWVALAFAAHPNHAAATGAFRAATSDRPACVCRSTQQTVPRLLSLPTILSAYGVSGLTNRDALETLTGFMASPSVGFRGEPPGLVPPWHRFGSLPSASPKVWMDAYLAAFATTGIKSWR